MYVFGTQQRDIPRFHKDFHLSKSLSWLLRHGACEEGFELSPEGYLEVYKILQHPLFKSRYQISDVVRVVKQDVKQRFKLRQSPLTGNLEIKANQGHSIPTISDAGLTPIFTPIYSTVVHGTYYKWWTSIERDGLNRMSRNHIHFAKGTLDDPAVISGLRKDAEILIYINLPKALADGYKFFESENGVILTSGNHRGFLKPDYFLKAVCVKTETNRNYITTLWFKNSGMVQAVMSFIWDLSNARGRRVLPDLSQS